MNDYASLEVEEGPRSKRSAILHAAIEEFGRSGYEATKWAEVASRVGIGQTALYHYFESRAHCLFTIMRIQLQRSHEGFLKATDGVARPADALRAALRAAYDLPNHEVLQMRILQSNFALLSGERTSHREEAERFAARELVRLIEKEWTDLLSQGMHAKAWPTRDAHLLARAVLGSIVSVWRWYRPDGPLTLEDIADFMTDCCLRMVEG